MKYGLFLGCNMPTIRPDAERGIRLSLEKLGVEIVECEGYSCCPGYGAFPAADEAASLAVSGRNLAIAEATGVDIAVQCGSCYSVMRHANHSLHDKERLDKTNELLKLDGKHYSGHVKVRHMIDLLYNEIGTEKIRDSIVHSLEGFKVVVQYPCHTLWPGDVMGFDDARDPHMLSDLVRALGAEVPRYSREFQCCGGAGGFAARNKPQAVQFARRKFDAMVEEVQPDVVIVSCITCLMWMNNVQVDFGEDWTLIPVLDYNQLLSLCMGFNPQEIISVPETPKINLDPRFKLAERIAQAPAPASAVEA